MIEITGFPTSAKTSEPFVLKGTANLNDGEELQIRVDNDSDVIITTVKDGKWEINLTIDKSGDHIVEVIASEQDKKEITISLDDSALIKPDTNPMELTELNEDNKNVALQNSSDQNIEYNEILLNVINNDKLTANEKKALITEIRKLQPGLEDRWVYRFAVSALAGAIGLSIIGTFTLLWNGKPVSDGLIGIGATSVGAIAGLLTPGSNKQ